MERWTCARCGEACERLKTRGRFPKFCLRCRPNYGRNISKRVRAEVSERDGWVCQICLDPVDRALTGTRSQWRASMDHIIPSSVGGDESPENLRLAHFWCNSVRGAATYEDEVFRVA